MTIRKLAVLMAAAFAVLSPVLQFSLGLGQSPSEFSARGDETLRAAGYAFSIWSLIYVGLAAFAIYQALPVADRSPAVARAAWPGAVAMFGIGAWIWATAGDQNWLTVAIIFTAAVAAIVALAGARASQQRLDHLLVGWPFAALAGWLTVATALNFLTVLTKLGYVADNVAVPAGLAGIGAAVAVALLVLLRTRSLVYALPVAWGLGAVFAAERNDNLIAAGAALAAAAMLLIAAGALSRRGAKLAVLPYPATD